MDIMTALYDEEEIARRCHSEIKRNAEKKNSEDIARCTKLPVSEIDELANLQPVWY